MVTFLQTVVYFCGQPVGRVKYTSGRMTNHTVVKQAVLQLCSIVYAVFFWEGEVATAICRYNICR